MPWLPQPPPHALCGGGPCSPLPVLPHGMYPVPSHVPSAFPTSLQGPDKPAEGKDGEAAVLKSPGVPVCMATFQLCVYRAEDLPQRKSCRRGCLSFRHVLVPA